MRRRQAEFYSCTDGESERQETTPEGHIQRSSTAEDQRATKDAGLRSQEGLDGRRR